MQFNPRKHGYEAGIALWWSQFSHATIGITLVELYDVGSVYGGMLFGLYALGDGEPVLDPADFSDICILEG
ncbi:hypothetical protein FOXG_15785 [Fusarium oxysporum f. sp. lycopersici 4287]|uniref:Uncharacterized protein n=2 Tax=Fusarium oxysporum TaxID=5507 RepID=A0A0J9W5N9_FUSO4|nr:hypothetical protein FOXG_15785 [Fusarium oxysporum f. sp. lycopersici 4287]KNB18155.1 hypothetical protein FOXG_15785 [Fusarium oxysporum f. sp. lycopersici 4287]